MLKTGDTKDTKKLALKFILLMGIVSALGDVTYEGAKSVYGPYLAFLGAGATTIGFVSGLGEFVGYVLRLLSGYFSDKTKHHWLIAAIGYGMLISVPMLAFAGNWQYAAVFIILERTGKAIRSPARDAILSHATKEVGRGYGFGIHEALDQLGAIIGPLIFTAALTIGKGYRGGFSFMWIPAVSTVAMLLVARSVVPEPEKLETGSTETEVKRSGSRRLPKQFWIYGLFTMASVAGFANFQVMSYHFIKQDIISEVHIPTLYALAMAVDGVTALIVGKAYDRKGLKSLFIIPLLTLPIPFLAFSKSVYLAVISVFLWGIVMGVHETIMRAAIADITPIENRGSAYGFFNTLYGGSWFIGSTLMGYFYEEVSVVYIYFFVSLLQLAAFIIFRKLEYETVSNP